MEDDTTKIGAAILIGGMIGAAIALLYAPKSGRETRKEIVRAARRGKNRTVDLIEDTIDEVNDLVNDLKKESPRYRRSGSGPVGQDQERNRNGARAGTESDRKTAAKVYRSPRSVSAGKPGARSPGFRLPLSSGVLRGAGNLATGRRPDSELIVAPFAPNNIRYLFPVPEKVAPPFPLPKAI